jgi:hypothetical protein
MLSHVEWIEGVLRGVSRIWYWRGCDVRVPVRKRDFTFVPNRRMENGEKFHICTPADVK